MMRAPRLLLGIGWHWAFGVGALLAMGCSASGSDGSQGSGASGSSSDGGGGSGTGGDLGLGAGGPGEEQENAEVFAHSARTLFRLDPNTREVKEVADFVGCVDNVIDIAVNEQGQMFGATFGSLFSIDKETAKCTKLADGSYPNSLSFVPKGTVDPDEEALVGYNSATYVRIDTTTGFLSTLGELVDTSNPIGGYYSSGDIVSVIGGGTYLTVTGADCDDCIVEVDPANGKLKRVIGMLNYQDVFGLAFWGGSAYGFTAEGALIKINLENASTSEIPIPSAPAFLEFFGAGSTTAAPLTPIE
ncbi:hypothetical protein [Chondromyces apiculatus]|uniref:Lipoprotein n=1 Tax=Chondromyces apiculatus DSM 436 TaxID=1192034 RepID=A0A017SSW9_9BACT|nr:hypothetical protein [Chondromyces apiculatus]EYF00073.1 Hypothetical protein CAP_1395 [Chondromyces apiculatus DSM 436]